MLWGNFSQEPRKQQSPGASLKFTPFPPHPHTDPPPFLRVSSTSEHWRGGGGKKKPFNADKGCMKI